MIVNKIFVSIFNKYEMMFLLEIFLYQKLMTGLICLINKNCSKTKKISVLTYVLIAAILWKSFVLSLKVSLLYGFRRRVLREFETMTAFGVFRVSLMFVSAIWVLASGILTSLPLPLTLQFSVLNFLATRSVGVPF